MIGHVCSVVVPGSRGWIGAIENRPARDPVLSPVRRASDPCPV
jgi:hypothetical protein